MVRQFPISFRFMLHRENVLKLRIPIYGKNIKEMNKMYWFKVNSKSNLLLKIKEKFMSLLVI